LPNDRCGLLGGLDNEFVFLPGSDGEGFLRHASGGRLNGFAHLAQEGGPICLGGPHGRANYQTTQELSGLGADLMAALGAGLWVL
jgi:hypothetical protein